jgi:hypothetical protein
VSKKPLKLTPENIGAFVPSSQDISYTHSVFAQCFFPTRKLPNAAKEHQRKNGQSSILIEAGSLLNPQTGDFEKQDVPYGAAARLVMAHIQNHAIRAPNVEEAQTVPMGDSLRNFFSQFGKEWGGKNGR